MTKNNAENATNAYQAMEEKSGVLNVSLKEIELGEFDLINPKMEPGRYVCLIVADSGVGITKDVVEKIFDPFFTTKKKGKGTGMGGTIKVYSELDKGTEFKIYFPAEKKSFKNRKTHSVLPIQGGNEQILLVDDEEGIIALEKQVLERLGYRVISRTSRIEALEAFRAAPEKYDLVISDVAMPNLSGDKLAKKMIKIRPDISILLCTGVSETVTEEKASELGAYQRHIDKVLSIIHC